MQDTVISVCYLNGNLTNKKPLYKILTLFSGLYAFGIIIVLSKIAP